MTGALKDLKFAADAITLKNKELEGKIQTVKAFIMEVL